MFMSENALAPAAFPSLLRMETEVVNAALNLLGAGPLARGSLTSGGTESIFLAVKAARDLTLAHRGSMHEPYEILMPRSAHPAFDKASHYLGLRPVRLPVGPDYRADLDAFREAINHRTIMIVASAPCLPYGTIDCVAELGNVALDHGLWLHVDACIGGYLAPFVRKLGYSLPDFDFSVPGVRSISADLHKYGYTAKGASTILYANEEAYEYQSTRFSGWPKGSYYTPTFLGTRSGGAIAAAWAVLNYLGEEGYLEIAARVMAIRQRYIDGIGEIEKLRIVGQPDLSVFAFTSDIIDVMTLADGLVANGWYISRISEPLGIHQTVTLAHEPIVDEYIRQLSSLSDCIVTPPNRSRSAEVVTY
jgi:glutamate/tyrosine decarboxylase-like PLP-dependent enzyme